MTERLHTYSATFNVKIAGEKCCQRQDYDHLADRFVLCMGSVRDCVEMSSEVQQAEANKGLWRFLSLLFPTLVTKPGSAEGHTGSLPREQEPL